jgi:hypothetical protein
MSSLLLSETALPNWGLHPRLTTIVDRRGTSAEDAQKEDNMGDSPAPNRDPALSAKVTNGRLSALISRWKVRCHLLWVDGSRPPVHTPLLGINVEEPWDNHNGRKVKGHFLARQWSLFPYLTFLSLLVPGLMTKLLFGAYLASSQSISYLDSGLLLGRPPLLSFFPQSS